MKLCSDFAIGSNEQSETNPRNAHPLWKALPQELRLMVLEKLPPLATERHEMARWASVSKEWQYFFEPGIFESLSIRPCRREIGRMDQVVRGYRTKLVRNISLLIGTAEFTGAEYNQQENVNTVAAINVVVTKALTALFSVLSQWGKATPEHHIALELCAGSNAENHNKPPCNAFHRYSCHRAQGNRTLDGKKRLLSTFSYPDFQTQELPQVPIIERFSMDRQHYRSFPEEFWEKIIASMPCIQYFGYMYWPAFGRNDRGIRDVASEKVLRAVMNSHRIQTLTVWNALMETFPLDLSQYRSFSYSLIPAALEASYRRQRVALPNVIDAIDFFAKHIKATSTGAPANDPEHLRCWPCLTHLALTNHVLRLLKDAAGTNFLISAAGMAATHMPKLEKMEVFSPTEPFSFSLRFDIGEDNTAKLTIAATWQLEIPGDVIKPWQQVADRRALRLVCEVETIGAEELHSKLQLFPEIAEW